MTQQKIEEKTAYYLYKKGAKPNSSSPIQTEVVASDTGIALEELRAMFGNSKYFNFTNGTTVGLLLTKEGLDFVESRSKRVIGSMLLWGTFIAAIISAVPVVAGFFKK